MSNPYHALLSRWTENMLDKSVKELSHGANTFKNIDEERFRLVSGMKYAEMANHLIVGAYCWANQGRWFQNEKIIAWCEELFKSLIAAGCDGTWQENDRGGNADRFTFLPMLEAFLFLKDGLSDSMKENFIEITRTVLKVQYEEYGEICKGYCHELYPNMDANYALIMHYGSKILQDKTFAEEYDRFMERLTRAQFPDGAWTYIRDSNECPHYHEHIVLVLSRIAEVSNDTQAIRQIQKSVPYYPLSISANGVAEGHTSCWWKNVWEIQNSMGPDTVSSLTGDGQNRWIADRLREKSIDDSAVISNFSGLFAVYSSLAWRENIPSVPLPEIRTAYDANIEGPRGHFPEWSWAATGRYMSETAIGANRNVQGQISALMGVIPQIPYWRPGEAPDTESKLRLSTFPPGSYGKTEIKDDEAEFFIEYRMMGACQFWNQEAFPYNWKCRQHWRMGREKITGKIEIESMCLQKSTPPRILIRFGRGNSLTEDGHDHFVYGGFDLKMENCDFPERKIVRTDNCGTIAYSNASQIWLMVDRDEREKEFSKGETYKVNLCFKTVDFQP